MSKDSDFFDSKATNQLGALFFMKSNLKSRFTLSINGINTFFLYEFISRNSQNETPFRSDTPTDCVFDWNCVDVV